ncbi:MAG: hypothetical protein ACYDH6_15780 [Acidimicrobiales bacterium]
MTADARIGGRLRRSLLAALAAATLGAGVIGLSAQSGSGASLSVIDVGVAITGPQTAVTNGLDALIKATLHNDGIIAPSATMTVATGGKVDPLLPLPSNCHVTTGTTDSVNCSYTAVAGTEPTVSIAVTTPATGSSMTSTATETPTLPNVVLGDTDTTATWTTTLSTSSPCGTSCTQAFVPNGGSVQRSANGTAQKFSVPANATWTGGGVLVTLDEVNTTSRGITCAESPCGTTAAEAKFQPANSSATPDPTHPLIDVVKYNAEEPCSGDGEGGDEGSSCPPIYFLPSGQTTGNATQVVHCTTYGTTSTVASTDPCLNNASGTPSSVSYQIVLLKDIIFPPIRL